jgi:hypothetical protein
MGPELAAEKKIEDVTENIEDKIDTSGQDTKNKRTGSRGRTSP